MRSTTESAEDADIEEVKAKRKAWKVEINEKCYDKKFQDSF